MSGIRKEFGVHLLNKDGLERAAKIARTFSTALNEIEEACGTDGRELAIVRTKLEEACFFAKRAMASRPENQIASNAAVAIERDDPPTSRHRVPA